jgi:cytidylate kinase
MGQGTSDRLLSALERACRHWVSKVGVPDKAGASKSPRWAIAISREAGINATAIAHEVAQRLGWIAYDRELLEHIAREMRLHTSLLESVDEHLKSWLQESLDSFMGIPTISECSYVRHLIETILALGSHGNCIIVGRGATEILERKTTLRVRMVAPLKDRIALTSQESGLSVEEASKHVEKIDRERRQFIKEYFQRDVADPSNFDLVLNTGRFSTIECAELIEQALFRFQARSKELHRAT